MHNAVATSTPRVNPGFNFGSHYLAVCGVDLGDSLACVEALVKVGWLSDEEGRKIRIAPFCCLIDMRIEAHNLRTMRSLFLQTERIHE